MVKTTVVIPNYNGIKYIKGCLDSLMASTVKVDIVVVDNASTDGSKELIRDDYPGVKVIPLKSNTGFCHAVNVGIKASSTEYVFLFNNDASVYPNTIEILENDLDKYPGCFSVQAKMLSMADPTVVDSAGDEFCALGWAYAWGKDRPAKKFKGIRPVFSACGGASLYRKCVFEEIGYFDENHFAYLEDVDIGYRANIFGYKNIADMDAKVLHAGSASSGSRHNEFKVRLSAKNSVYMMFKNMPLLQLIINYPFALLGIAIKGAFFIKKGFGAAYFGGIWDGLKLSYSKKGMEKKIPYKKGKASTYIAMEVILLINVLRRLFA